eukprot:SAG11_NODE_3635_length_2322_cov_1.254611_2_plen_229_part_00
MQMNSGATSISDDFMKTAQEKFTEYDSDDNGALGRNELAGLLRDLKLLPVLSLMQASAMQTADSINGAAGAGKNSPASHKELDVRDLERWKENAAMLETLVASRDQEVASLAEALQKERSRSSHIKSDGATNSEVAVWKENAAMLEELVSARDREVEALAATLRTTEQQLQQQSTGSTSPQAQNLTGQLAAKDAQIKQLLQLQKLQKHNQQLAGGSDSASAGSKQLVR